jgi:NAD(P)-dependent dehydrogenase (short-subunit alcohol dehydrogenase family)
MAAMSRRAALVTGASSGIGLEIARMLLAEGHGVTLVARRPDKLERAAAELAAEGSELATVAVNVADDAGLAAAVAEHRARFGRLDVLVNNAGVGYAADIAGYPTKHLDMQIAVNLRATVVLYRECVELLRAAATERGTALVVNVASIAGKSPEPSLSVYSATKFGVVGFTQAMNQELAAEGIKSCAICPGWVETPMTEFIQDQIPPEQMLRPQDVAETVRFLLRVSPACVVPEVVLGRAGQLP